MTGLSAEKEQQQQQKGFHAKSCGGGGGGAPASPVPHLMAAAPELKNLNKII